MRAIVHLSDLHFGRIDEALLDPLIAAVDAAAPDLVAISGDLTQRARTGQFRDARDFLARLPTPQIVVPGNHDIPLYDVLRRFAAPLARFERYITADPLPFHQDDEIAVVGVNTARSLTFKGGRINDEQVALVASRLATVDPDVLRVVVTHHPFDLPGHAQESDLVGRASMAMKAFAQCRVDLFLSGHLHHSHHSSTAERYAIEGHAALVVQSGTATSTRGRGEANAFNVVRVDGSRLAVEVWNWKAEQGAYSIARTSFFHRTATGWSNAPDGVESPPAG
ncbi:MAG: metallophosphoesterase [Xanthomonadaceae bacterium]|nr:metallophosphoesterase [Xanthomonadaceae bacterium]